MVWEYGFIDFMLLFSALTKFIFLSQYVINLYDQKESLWSLALWFNTFPMSFSSTLFLIFFIYSFSLSTHRYILLVLKSTISMSLSLYSASFALVKDWLQGHSNACSITGSYSQRDTVFSLKLCCYCFETLSNFWGKGLEFPFCSGLLQMMWPVLLVPYILRLCGTHFS